MEHPPRKRRAEVVVAYREQPLPAEPRKTAKQRKESRCQRAGRGGAQEPAHDQEDPADSKHHPAEQPEAEY